MTTETDSEISALRATLERNYGEVISQKSQDTCPADEWANQRHQASWSAANDQPPTFDARVNERHRENPIPYILLSIAILVGMGLVVVGVLHWAPFGR